MPQQQSNLNLTAKLHKLGLDQKYKEILGTDLEEMKKFEKRKQKEKDAIKKLVDQGKIQIIKGQKPSNKVEQEPAGLKLTEDGKLKDDSGNIVQIREAAASLKINQQKKKEEKLKEMLKKQRLLKDAMNDIGKFFDKNLAASMGGQTAKREKQKVNIRVN